MWRLRRLWGVFGWEVQRKRRLGHSATSGPKRRSPRLPLIRALMFASLGALAITLMFVGSAFGQLPQAPAVPQPAPAAPVVEAPAPAVEAPAAPAPAPVVE